MAISSFLNVNGYDLPCPHVGFNYIISTPVNAGRNAKRTPITMLVTAHANEIDSFEINLLLVSEL